MTSHTLPLLAPLVFIVGCTAGVKPTDTVVLRACPLPAHQEISRSCTTETQWSLPVRTGDAPARTDQHAGTITATITALDVARGTAKLTGPRGQSTVVKAHNAADLRRIRVGDVVDISDSEALSLAMFE
jgi:hypothetical protein